MRRAAPALLAFAALIVAGAGLLEGSGAPALRPQVQGPPPPPPPPPMPASANPPPANLAPAEAGRGAISGVVVDATTNAPIADAVVYLGPPTHGPPGGPLRMITDGKGRFVFRDLPAYDGYFINVTKYGYFEGFYGRGSSGQLGGRIAIADGEWFREANVRLDKPGAISGVVVDDHGEPIVGAYVRVLTSMLVGGSNQTVAGAVTTTDDRGIYRIYGLDAGRYLVQVPSVQHSVPAAAIKPPDARSAAAVAGQPVARDGMMPVGSDLLVVGKYASPLPARDGRPQAYPPTFYPAARDVAGATWIALKKSEERTGVDFRINPVATYRVSGTIEGPPTSYENLTLRLMLPGTENLGTGSEAATALAASDGRFTFLNVPEGAYTLVADRNQSQFELSSPLMPSTPLPMTPMPNPAWRSGSSGVPSGPPGLRMSTRSTQGDAWWARVPVDVTGRDVTVSVALRKTATLSGRFVWAEGESGDFPLAVNLEPANASGSLGVAQSIRPSTAPRSETFSVPGLMPGPYLLRVLGNGRVKSVTWSGQDYTDRPFDASSGADIPDVVVTLTSKQILFMGMARNARNQPSNEMAVIVFPIERELWTSQGFSPTRIKALQTTNSGAFLFRSLPEGEYYAVAVDAELIDGWKDPEFLARVAPLATRLSLKWDQNAALELRVVSVK